MNALNRLRSLTAPRAEKPGHRALFARRAIASRVTPLARILVWGSLGLGPSLGALAASAASAASASSAASAAAPSCCEATWGLHDGQTYNSKSTGYFPDGSEMEGGFVDRRGNPLKTLQQFTQGKSAFVSTAMDPRAFAYGQKICLPEVNASLGKAIPFKVVDSGGAFIGKGTSRIDVCTGSESASLADSVNRQVTIVVCE